jgi:hypothetical protein
MIPGAFADAAIDTWAVIGSFVALSILVVELSQHVVDDRVFSWFGASERLQPVGGALLGLVPGCGGAIAVMPLYSRGKVGFGTVVATLAATAGDSAFVLLAVAPEAAVVAYGIAFATAIVAGVLVEEYGLGVDRLASALGRSTATPAADGGTITNLDRTGGATCEAGSAVESSAGLRPWLVLATWWVVAGAGLFVGVRALLLQAPVRLVLLGTDVVGVVAAVGLALSAYVYSRGAAPRFDALGSHRVVPALWRSAAETSRIVLWVGGALLVYKLAVGAGLQLDSLAVQAGVLAPVGAALVGAVPGCGVHVGVVTAYGEGAVPFSALVANAISQDGDAFFPLLAVDRRAAVVATVYTVVPGVVVGAAVHFVWRAVDLAQFGFGLAG